MVLCACGCGKEIIPKPWHKYTGFPKFIRSHSNKSAEVKLKISAGNKGKLRSEKTKLKISTNSKGRTGYMTDKQHTEETKLKMSAKAKLRRHSKESKLKMRASIIKRINSGKYLRTWGKRSYYQSPLQGQVCFRSSYELAYAKYLDSIHELWMYEMETFDLGNTTYTPDFFLPRLELFVEIKGYMLSKAQEKINQFKEQYPWNLEIIRLKELTEMDAK